jgi:hypothetical protein
MPDRCLSCSADIAPLSLIYGCGMSRQDAYLLVCRWPVSQLMAAKLKTHPHFLA